MSELSNYFSNFSFLQFIAGAIAVAGVGAIAVGIAQANINRLNDEDASLGARIKALEDDTALSTSLSSLSATVSTISTQASANCAKVS